jgi:uncharacterized membrane protein YfcA
MLFVLVIGLGVVAGALTTTAGFGGGLLLVAVFATVRDPLFALTITSMALLIGNVHRTYLLRESVSRTVGVPYMLGALPGSLAGALVVVAIPAVAVQILIALGAAAALLRSLGRLRWQPGSIALTPAGVGIGVVAATTGGAGLLQGPLFMSAGLSGDAFVATMSAAAVALHVGRVIGYAQGGLVSVDLIDVVALLMAAILVGNVLGRRLSKGLAPRTRQLIETWALVVCALVALLGLA